MALLPRFRLVRELSSPRFSVLRTDLIGSLGVDGSSVLPGGPPIFTDGTAVGFLEALLKVILEFTSFWITTFGT
jgi:hypothetical protein